MLEEEEKDVARALSEYTTDTREVHPDDFTPIRVLYQTYRDHIARFLNDPTSPDPLDIRSFGAALMRVFPDLDDYDPAIGGNPNKVRRRYHGKKMWGYMGLKGPLSLRTHGIPGRPKHDYED